MSPLSRGDPLLVAGAALEAAVWALDSAAGLDVSVAGEEVQGADVTAVTVVIGVYIGGALVLLAVYCVLLGAAALIFGQ